MEQEKEMATEINLNLGFSAPWELTVALRGHNLISLRLVRDQLTRNNPIM